MATPMGKVPVPKSTLGANEPDAIVPLFGKVTSKILSDDPIRLFVVTVIGSYVAPDGTVTVRLVALAADTEAVVAPK